MNPELEAVYSRNIKYLYSILEATIESALEEQCFIDGELYSESLGTLKLSFSNGKELIFNCDGDAESLSIKVGGFIDKGTLETDLDDNLFKWKVQAHFTEEELAKLGKVKDCQIEFLTSEFGALQSGCKIFFQNGDYLSIWTIESDNIFYGINQSPSYTNLYPKSRIRSV